jgi:hypothetical protein
MHLEQQEATEAQLLQRERSEKFGGQAAERIRAAENCLFSLLPHEELARLAGEWYQACSQAMLRGNYSQIDIWVRSQSQRAAEQGFAPQDLLKLIQICRQSAIELESWNEDIFSAVDEVMQEAFGAIRSKLAWKDQNGIDRPASEPSKPEAAAPSAETVQEQQPEEWTSDRRKFARNRLRFPIRVISSGPKGFEEITQTHSISRSGLYFVTPEEYKKDQVLKINFPYWSEHGGINTEYSAKVVRLDRRPDQTWGVGVDFLESLGRKPQHSPR